jgi:hypothetical protein
MLDPIIDAKMNKFREKMEVENTSESEVFEKFVNFTILSNHQPGAFNGGTELFDKVNVGGYGDIGIDGIGIKINNILIRSLEEAKEIVERFPKLDIEFIFIQSKFKDIFTNEEFLKFTEGVREFLDEEQKMPRNDAIRDLIKIKECLIDPGIIEKWYDTPKVRIYYVTMAKSHDSKTQEASAERFKKDIEQLRTYQEPLIHFIDRTELKRMIESSEGKFTANISFKESMPLSEEDVDGVTDSCVLLCYAKEFKKMLSAPDGLIRKSLFEDNVRDFQGHNLINNAISDTIRTEPQKFALLNNGITIVCDKYTHTKKQICIENPQIVNGCQTSHAIFTNKDTDLEKTPIIIKLISTDNIDITNQIVKGTNSQTTVDTAAFETIKPFHKDLGDFIAAFASNDTDDCIYYERRSKQYDHNSNIKNYQKINLRIMIQSFVGMFLCSPHFSHHHELWLLNKYSNQIFQDLQSKWPYYIAALSYYKIGQLFRKNIIDKKKYQTYEMHILMIFHEIAVDKEVDINNEKEIEDQCKKLLEILNDYQKLSNLFKESVKLLDDALKNWVEEMKRSPYGIRDVEAFTDLLRSKMQKGSGNEHTARSSRCYGKIIQIGTDKYGRTYGHIERQPNNIFFHSMNSPDVNFTGKKYCGVSYETVPSNKGGLMAVNIQIIHDITPKDQGLKYQPFVGLNERLKNKE